eukprot:Skav222170  [mRNA]  locus=scaffold3048:191879:195206:+ [translate_table: standard]
MLSLHQSQGDLTVSSQCFQAQTRSQNFFVKVAMAKKAEEKAKAAPKATKATPAEKAKAKAKSEAAAKASAESNLVTQGKVAVARLAKHDDGSQLLSDEELVVVKAKVHFLEQYQSLPKNDSGKLEMLASWELDKTGMKWLTRTKEVGQERESTENESHGHLSFQIAKLEGLELKDPFLQALLAELPSDMEWDESVPRELALKKAGEKRYLYQATDLSKVRVATVERDFISGGADGKNEQKALLASAGGGSSSAPVKIEAGVAEKQQKLTVLRSGKKKLEAQYTTCQDLGAAAKAANNQAAQTMADTCGQKLDVALQGLRQELANLDQCSAFGQDEIKKADDLITSCDAHCDGLGLWGDGVPYSSDRTKSIEVLAFNIVTHKEKDLRFPIAIVPKHWMAKNTTYDAIFQVLKWSFTCLAMACWPATDHAGQPWGVGQSARQKKAGQPLPRAILLQVRGDWSFYKNTLNEKANCCWLCDCTPDRVIEVSAFPTRKQKTSWEAIAQMPARSPLLGIPFFDLSMLVLDWLHIVDLGIAQQFLGSTFKHIAKKIPERNFELQCKALHIKMKFFYRSNDIASKLDMLKPSMIQAQGKPWPKLRAKAGETRALVPFAMLLCQEMLDRSDTFEHTILRCAEALNDCYEQLSSDHFAPHIFQDKAKKYALLYVSLATFALERDLNLYKVTPKLHLFLEMADRADRCPSDCWTYRDESCGGEISELAKRRGGSSNPHSVGKSFFERFAAKIAVPSL